MPGRKLAHSLKWTPFHNRDHAFVGDIEATYCFGHQTTFDTMDQSSEATDEVMDIAREIKHLIREHAATRASCLRDLHLPHCDVASLARYPPGGRIPTHSDNEEGHASNAIISVSFGAPPP